MENITRLLFQRDQAALSQMSQVYGNYCHTIAFNILRNSQDAEEAVQDAYLAVWNSVPPNEPQCFSAYLGRIVKNSALNIYKKLHAEKRGGGEGSLPIDELEDLVSGAGTEGEVDKEEMLKAINSFLSDLPKRTRLVFVGRYWSCFSTEELSKKFNISKHNVNSLLSRTRKSLKAYLRKEGFDL